MVEVENIEPQAVILGFGASLAGAARQCREQAKTVVPAFSGDEDRQFGEGSYRSFPAAFRARPAEPNALASCGVEEAELEETEEDASDTPPEIERAFWAEVIEEKEEQEEEQKEENDEFDFFSPEEKMDGVPERRLIIAERALMNSRKAKGQSAEDQRWELDSDIFKEFEEATPLLDPGALEVVLERDRASLIARLDARLRRVRKLRKHWALGDFGPALDRVAWAGACEGSHPSQDRASIARTGGGGSQKSGTSEDPATADVEEAQALALNILNALIHSKAPMARFGLLEAARGLPALATLMACHREDLAVAAMRLVTLRILGREGVFFQKALKVLQDPGVPYWEYEAAENVVKGLRDALGVVRPRCRSVRLARSAGPIGAVCRELKVALEDALQRLGATVVEPTGRKPKPRRGG